MDDTKVISDESGRPSLPALRIRHVAPFSIYPEVDKPDEEDEDSSGEVKSVESSIVDETGSGDSAPSVAEEKYHERDDPHEEKPESPNADLRELESSSPSSAEAKSDHSDGEAKDITEMVDERDEECNKDNSGEITAVESSTMSEPRSSDSGSCIDDPELHVGESSPPSPEAKGDHPDGEDEDNTETPGLRSNTSSAEPPDISTMKMAIRSGDPKAVNDLLERLSDTLAVDELTTTYGGNGVVAWEADEDDLVGDTSPILHAARSRNLAVFESVMKAMQAKLSLEKVKEMLAKNDCMEQSLLSLAALSGSKDVLEGVILIIQKEFTKSEVKEMLAKKDCMEQSILSLAALSGSKDVLEGVILIIQKEFTKSEVKEMLAKKDCMEQSLLSLAARSGSKDVLEGVILIIQKEFTKSEVKDMLAARDEYGVSPVDMAARIGSMDVLEHVLRVIREIFEDENVLGGDKRAAFSLLASAVRSGSMDVVEHVLSVIRQEFSENAVEEIMQFRDRFGASLLACAASSGSSDMFKNMLKLATEKLDENKVKEMISPKEDRGSFGLLNSAAKSGRVDMFTAVMATISGKLTDEEVKNIISCEPSLPLSAVRTKSVEMFKAVITFVVDYLPGEEVKNIISCESSLLSWAVDSRKVEMFKAVMTFVVDYLPGEEVVELLCEKGRDGSPIGFAIRCGNPGMCEIILQNIQDYLGHTKVQEELDDAFLRWKEIYEDEYGPYTTTLSSMTKILSMLVRHSDRPPTEFLQWAARDTTDGKQHLWPIFTEIVLSNVESASNPLTPGMNLSVPLAEAAEGAREGERRRLISLQKRVDEYVLEVLERLPQTMQGFDKGMSQCSALFEPEGPRNDICGRPGPLRVAFERRHQMESLCAVPLVMEYLSHRFTSGLPDMRDSGRVLRDETAMSRLASEDDVGGLVLGDTQEEELFFVDLLQGTGIGVPSLSILPGAQFIIAGLLAKPNTYYRVPAMRMALDFVVYIIMLYFYSSWVLLPEDGPLTTAEIIFVVYVLAGVLTEVREIRRNLKFYLQDPWNFFDALALVMLAGGFTVRLAIGDNPWGRALYALSAPLVFSRILFFVQILQFQGPMIQVMFSMGMVLLQFAVVLLVVMMGFAMALHPLLRDDNGFTFGAILLLLFKTLLGDVEAFEEFDESTENRYSIVGRLLLVLYLVVMTIMLLNLLIAVLSTKHTKVDVNADKEYKVSRARIIEHYRQAVAFNILPAPINILQLVLTLPFLLKGKAAAHTKMVEEAVGQVAFWLVLSPLAFAGGFLLWVTSSVYNIGKTLQSLLSLQTSSEDMTDVFWRDIDMLKQSFLNRNHLLDFNDIPANLFRGILTFFWCALGAPLFLLAFWLRQPFLVIYNGVIALIRRQSQGERDVSTPSASASGHKKSDADVQKMLRDAGTEASDLRKYLEDPMCDPEVRPDEIDRGTTVKHMKLLRDRLEKTFNERVDHLDDKFSEHVDHLDKKFNDRDDHLDKKFSEHVDQLGKEFDERVDNLDKKISEHVDHLDSKFSEHVHHLDKRFNERVDGLETNTNALVGETIKQIGLVLESLRGK